MSIAPNSLLYSQFGDRVYVVPKPSPAVNEHGSQLPLLLSKIGDRVCAVLLLPPSLWEK